MQLLLHSADVYEPESDAAGMDTVLNLGSRTR